MIQQNAFPEKSGIEREVYVVWNNKGGVGKSTIVFNLAARYAQLNPQRQVLVIDLCPQANSTMMFLGGGTKGEEELLKLQKPLVPQTIVGYLADQIERLSGGSPSGSTFNIQVQSINEHMPSNLWLVPGDGNLELIAPAISYYADARIPEKAWLNVHNWVKALIEKIAPTPEWTVFIDTNPSFAIHTELAIVAGTRLLIPFKADDSSRVATKALFDLIYGPDQPHPVYSKYTFAVRAQETKLTLPRCHVFIGNQFTQYKGSAKAFKGMSNAVLKSIYDGYCKEPLRYTPHGVINAEEDFHSAFVYELRDFNSAGVVAAHQGRLLENLQETTYEVHGESVQLDKRRIQECSSSIDKIVKML